MHGQFHLKRTLTVVGALAATPLVVFWSTSVSLYVGNQEELSYQISALTPFAAAGMITLVCGGLVFAASGRRSWSLPMWAYLLAGPTFLALTALRELGVSMFDHLLGTLVLAVVYVAGVLIANARAAPQQALGFFAVLALLFVLVDGARLATGFAWMEHFDDGVDFVDAADLDADGGHKPNIYHLVLDGFQSDVFSMVLNDAIRSDLGGFTYYPEANANYSMTSWSVPSIMLGSLFDFSDSQWDFQNRAMNSDASVLSTLKGAGYSTLAYTRKLYPFELSLFDGVTQHSENIDLSELDNQQTFISLWVYRYLPLGLSAFLAQRDWLIDRSDLVNLRGQTFLADSAPVESYLSFQQFLVDEADLAGSDRYTFIHLLLPHSPYAFDAQCTEVRSGTVTGQAKCAIAMIGQLIARLEAAQRFDSSLIIVHGDHGSHYELVDGALSRTEFRSHRTLLLVKPSGRDGSRAFRILRRPVSLLSVAPTLADFVGEVGDDHVASSLLDETDREVEPAERNYYVVRGERSMRRYVVVGEQLEFQEVIPLDSVAPTLTREDILTIPIVPVGQIVEAESGHLSAGVDVLSSLPDASGTYVRNGTVSFRFELEHAALVRVRGRLITPNGNNDSSFLRLDSGKARTWRMGKSRSWRWVESPFAWNVDKGIHILSIEYREPVYLDQVEIAATQQALSKGRQ